MASTARTPRAAGSRVTDGAAVTVRRGRDDDTGAVAKLWTEAYVRPPGGGREEDYRSGDVADSRAAGEVLVADREGALVGVVVLLPGTSHWARIAISQELEISRLAVARPARRSGVARTLVAACHRRARERDAPAIALWTRPAQRAAHRLYESLGYEREPERDLADAYGDCIAYRFRLSRGGG